jgi:hypothetical protein
MNEKGNTSKIPVTAPTIKELTNIIEKYKEEHSTKGYSTAEYKLNKKEHDDFKNTNLYKHFLGDIIDLMIINKDKVKKLKDTLLILNLFAGDLKSNKFLNNIEPNDIELIARHMGDDDDKIYGMPKNGTQKDISIDVKKFLQKNFNELEVPEELHNRSLDVSLKVLNSVLYFIENPSELSNYESLIKTGQKVVSATKEKIDNTILKAKKIFGIS